MGPPPSIIGGGPAFVQGVLPPPGHQARTSSMAMRSQAVRFSGLPETLEMSFKTMSMEVPLRFAAASARRISARMAPSFSETRSRNAGLGFQAMT